MYFPRVKTLLAGIVLMVAVSESGLVVAQGPECEIERKIAAHALDELTWKRLNRLYTDIGEGRGEEAYEALRKMMAQAGRDAYLEALLAQALAQLEWSRGDYDAALKFFEQAVNLDVLPNQAHFSLMYQIAQIYFMKARYEEALDHLALWLCKVPAENVTSSAYVLQASLYVRIDDYARALKAIDKAILLADNPEEQWFQIKLAALFELEQYPQAAETLISVIDRWPEIKMYWVQLSQVLFRLKKEDEALGIMALAFRKGILDSESDLVYLSSLYSHAGVPFRAAEVLEQGIRDGIVTDSEEQWSAVASHWYQAEELERSLSAYRQAGEKAGNGSIDLRRAYILVDLERWTEALSALNDAVTRGGLDDQKTGELYLLRGMAQFELEAFEKARADWMAALEYGRSREAAQQWINHLQSTQRTDQWRMAN
jgi:tetratricopeptide (TPR) repeat protein